MVNKEKKSILKTIEDYLIVLLLSLVILVSLTQIGMRLFFNSSIIWGDEFIKIIILWLAMIASVSASRSNRHLKIDLIDNFISNKISHFPKIISKLMGHSCVETAQKYYIQATDKGLERAIKMTELSDEEFDNLKVHQNSMIGHNSKNK